MDRRDKRQDQALKQTGVPMPMPGRMLGHDSLVKVGKVSYRGLSGHGRAADREAVAVREANGELSSILIAIG